MGRVTTYGLIADYLALGSARMVGWALKQLPDGSDVPAHRVVNRMGELSGRHHFNPPEKMQERLEREGITIVNDQVLHFQELVWNPSRELENEEPDL